jgi:ketosteroid isomerase-like protein
LSPSYVSPAGARQRVELLLLAHDHVLQTVLECLGVSGVAGVRSSRDLLWRDTPRVSRENVEAVHRVYEGWGRGDLRVPDQLYDPHVLLVLRPEFPDAGAYCGPDEIREYTHHLLAAWESFAISAENFIEAGDSVVVSVRQHAKGVGSGVPAEFRYFQVWTFRGGSVIRIESIRDRDDALEAVGLRA